MNKTETKSEHPGETSPVSLFTEWMQQGTESFFATQRILLDLVMRQNAMAMNTIREGLAVARPVSALGEIAGEGTNYFIAAQKILLQLARRQNEIVLNGVKERGPRLGGLRGHDRSAAPQRGHVH